MSSSSMMRQWGQLASDSTRRSLNRPEQQQQQQQGSEVMPPWWGPSNIIMPLCRPLGARLATLTSFSCWRLESPKLQCLQTTKAHTRTCTPTCDCLVCVCAQACVHIHRQRVQLCQAAQVGQQQDHQATPLNGLNGARQQVGGQSLKVLSGGVVCVWQRWRQQWQQ